MGLTEKNIWILIRYYDFHVFNSDNVQTSLREVVLPPLLTLSELKSMVYSWADISENDAKVIKIRQYNNCLIPLSGLFQGSSMEKPFIVEVVGVHQFYI